MGGGSKKQKVGNKYFFGVVTVPVRQHDYVSAIELSDKLAWDGKLKSGEISINKPKLFGGDEREGGFQGKIDVQDGAIDQPVNSYLANAKETLTGAMRGCVSFVWKKPYWGANTARLPKLRTRHTNIEGIHLGWRTDLAVIDPQKAVIGNAFYIIFDGDRNGNGTAWSAHRAALAEFVRSLKGNNWENSFYVIFAQPLSATQTTQRIRISTDEEYESLAVWIETRTRSNVNSWVNNLNLSNAASFYAAHDSVGVQQSFLGPLLAIFGNQTEASQVGRRYVIVSNNAMRGTTYVPSFNTDLSGLNVTQVLAIGGATNTIGGLVDERPDLVELDGQFNVSAPEDILWVTGDDDYTLGFSGDVAAASAFFNSPFQQWADINPAHAIRCLWIDPMRGGTVDASEIGDSFAVEAARYFDEGLGVSCKWRGIDQADADRLEIERHIDAISYRDLTTGKIELVSIRDNYEVGDLDTLDSSIVLDWSGLSRPRKSEIPNQLTTEYTRRDGKKGSVTRTNIAGVRRQGRVIKAQPIQYPWFSTESLGVRACLRDLRVVTSDVLSGTIPLSYLPVGLKPGGVVILNEPFLGINNVIVRVNEIKIGKYDDSKIYISVQEDKYASTQPVPIEEIDYSQLRPALDVDPRIVVEASYYQMVLAVGQSTVDGELDIEPDLGRLFITGAPANSNQLDARVATNTSGGTEWEDKGPVDFEPFGELVNSLSSDPTVTTFLINENNTIDQIFSGDLARIDEEIIRIDNLADQLDGTLLVTCGRGCLDGPPQIHAAGSKFVITSVVEPMIEDYIAGQTVNVKLLSRTGSNEQTLNEAITESLIFNSRAFRPYNVGNLKVDGSYSSSGPVAGSVTITWSHRDRTLQTTPSVDDFTVGNIGPETGVYYETVIQFYNGWELFYPVDGAFYDRSFFYTDRETMIYEVTAAVDPTDATTETVTIQEQPLYDRTNFYDTELFYFGSYNDLTSLLSVGVKSLRDEGGTTYENLITPTIDILPLLPVADFAAEELV